MSKPSLEDYVEVPERIQRFYEKYPEGSLQGEWSVAEVGGQTLIVYVARAYRDSEDRRPGIGTASEPFPGKTPYTKGSELMNAETSAWGRAIVALGFLAKDEKVASAEEVKLAKERGKKPSENVDVSGGPEFLPKPEVHSKETFEKKLADEVADLPGTVELATAAQLKKLEAAKDLLGGTRFDAYLRAQGVDSPDELTKEAAESVLTWAREQVRKAA